MKNLVMISLLCGLLFGCNSNHTEKTIEFWHFWTDPKAKPVIEQIVGDFEKANPGWKVNITDLTWADGHQKIMVAFGAGKPPDLLELGSDWIAEFAHSGALAPLQYDTSGILLAGSAMLDNKLYGRPWLVDSRVFYYNLSLFEKAVVPLPENWQGLLKACAAINNLGDNISGFGANSNEPHRLYKKFLPFLWNAGGDILCGDKICLNTPQMKKSLEYYSRLVAAGRVDGQKNLEDLFLEGKIGAIISGGWLLNRLEKVKPAFRYQPALMVPEIEGGERFSFGGGEFLVIPAKSAKKEISEKLMNLFVERQNSQLLCDSVGFGFPPYRNQSPADPAKKVLFEQLLNSKSAPLSPRWVYIEQVIESMVEETMLGKATADQAIADAEKKLTEITNR